ncbi:MULTISPECIES: tRNA isopentenyl-2-thiomethyl-A-37 hydroxylase MiaE [Shewanella]|uniref:tRNA isopentenyl-2-thiomethyl-A-37 hydroxylase MiaE n=1 Tax=Shewanella TaxID=22 RepID=UPI000D1AC262|nr:MULTISPECIES: tRNA isopentenyl-2-thiomethyl-A-37 hydroxylase MiaE [Shewanella]AVT46230.1 tRNA-(ms[2]io[6]A)-hydroxylase [Shewanella baltica]MCS6231687.1 tRNA-(ms[2]io[6]A)-hydroxylase [Shewanella baltica]MCU7997300.1 tRNA isopentenyl-2-thiomethyl-A-37 hydroxylase MiaE [Shewanella sp. SM95]MCU8028185.1 tRNA isopentenyl-2-thiomethyl-A-37 hydroxylase MiaE [Shewanella sp. SM73]MCU8037324.1 tRNA isopentenyl-2-thiomethyl-A-37 hydroxylase MiaE [Shewanella sp. SM69]
MYEQALLEPILSFLKCKTPDEWVTEAIKPENLSTILRDHLVCELKAAQSAVTLMRKYAVDKESAIRLSDWVRPYADYAYKKIGGIESLRVKNNVIKQVTVREDSDYGQELVDRMMLLIKEELHHFYQVIEQMEQKDIQYELIDAGRYAKGLLKHVKPFEPDALVDKLIIGAFIEARSCERFAKLAPHLDAELGKFYVSLLRSEARHYQDYLDLAEMISDKDICARVSFFADIEAELILSPDQDFKFHSGKPIN